MIRILPTTVVPVPESSDVLVIGYAGEHSFDVPNKRASINPGIYNL